MINVSGVSDARVAPCAAELISEEEQSLIIVSGSIRAQRLAEDLSFFTEDRTIMVLPEEDQFFLRYEARNQDKLIERMKALKALRKGEPVIVVAPVSAAVKKLTPHRNFEQSTVKLILGQDTDPEELKKSLVSMGYEYVSMVESPGQFSIRGGITDIYTPDGAYPYRVELFGTEVDSIRTFDPDTQRSVDSLKSVEVYPAKQLTISEELFRKTAEFVERYFKQGSRMTLCGRIQNDNYTNKNGEKVYSVQIIAEEVEFAERKSTADQNMANAGNAPAPAPASTAGDDFMNIPDGIDEGLPFN